ncbi:MAG: hypothetical protein Q9169_002272 [Polycauliona sp. 2 TL-2023]
MASRPQNVGIKAIEIYFPSHCVNQAELEKFDGVSEGKYTIGLGQTRMSFCDDREDIYSFALTTVSSLLRKFAIDPKSIGRLEVGTETLLDKSKSVKSVLMQLFEPSGNTNVEGVDTVNACYGGTNAIFNAINWIESSAWDGRNAIVCAGDIALYKKGNARPTGGAGCVAMLIGPDAPLAFEPGKRGSFMKHAYDFYKPDLTSEYPTVDGVFSVQCYTEAVDQCYKRYNEREATLQTKGLSNGVHKSEPEPEGSSRSPVDRFDHMVFHAPTCKLVAKSYARLLYNDFLADPKNPIFESVPREILDLDYPSSINDKTIEKTFMGLAKKKFAARVQPGIEVPTMCGNMYTASVYGSLVGLLSNVSGEEIAGKRIGIFSYGSGLASSLFSLRVVGDVSEMVAKVDLHKRLDARRVVEPKVYDEMCNLRERAHLQKEYTPSGDAETITKDTYYLSSIDGMFRRHILDPSIEISKLSTKTTISESRTAKQNRQEDHSALRLPVFHDLIIHHPILLGASPRLTPQTSRSSNPDIFCDEYALDSLHPSDGFRPQPFDDPTHDHETPRQPENTPQALPARDSASISHALNQRSSSLLFPQDVARYGPTHSGRATSFSDEPPNTALYRSTSRASTSTLPRTQSPYQGATGPSQPYAMYPQDVGFSRTPSMATTSTVRPRERSYAGSSGPTQPYGMYSQNIVPEDDVGTFQSLRLPAPAGFPGRSQEYRRRLGPDTEDVDDLIGPDGYTEQLPPYTRYPDDVPPKEAVFEPADALGVAHVESGRTRVTPADPFQSRESLQESGESIPERTEQSRSSEDATAVASSESLQRDEGGNFKERVKEKGKRRICCGKVPFWVVAVVVLLMIAVLAGTIGGVVGNARGEHRAVPAPQNKFRPAEYPATQSYFVSTITTTSLVDATPLASTPTNLPTLPTGSFFVPLRNLTRSANSCLQSYPMAWNCADEQDLKLDLSTAGSISISPRFPAQNHKVRFGPQLPQLDKPIPLQLMGDKEGMEKGPAWWFQQLFTKVVVVRDGDFNAYEGVNDKRWFDFQYARKEKRQSIAPVASKPWFCYWNNTTLEGFIYVTQNFSGQYQRVSPGYEASSSAAADPEALASDYGSGSLDSYLSSSSESPDTLRKRLLVDPTKLAAYSKDIKIVERRNSATDPAPYCVHMQIMNDGSAQPVPDEIGNPATIELIETSPTYETRKEKRAKPWQRGATGDGCECEWISN